MTGRPDLIERTEELRALHSIAAAAVHGSGSVGLVVGPVASGKSVLLRALGEQASAAGSTVLRAVGAQAEQHAPLSIVAQLLQQSPLDPERLSVAQRLLATAAEAARVHAADTELSASGAYQLPAGVMQALCAVLLDLSKSVPLLICIDDAHHADALSLQWLLFLIRRLGSARIAVVLTECTARQHPQPAFHAELLRQPHCRRIMLGPLTREGVVQLLATGLDAQRADQLAPRVDALTGGNPLLVHSLLEDVRSSTRLSVEQYPAGLGGGFAFSQAVVSCLHRSEPAALTVARGIAVFGEHASDHLLGQLLGLFPSLVAGVIDALDSAGLLENGRFRHPAVRTAVLQDTDAAELSRLHAQAARLLYDQGAPERAIAEQLLVSDHPGEEWSTRVLCDVARQALFDGDADLARRCVEHAYRGCSDTRQRGQVLTLLAGVEWQLQPGNATRHLPMLTAALRAGELGDRHSVVVVKYLLRHGRLTEATGLMEHLLAQGRAIEGRTASEVQTVKLLLSSSYPGALAELPPFGSCTIDQDGAPAAVRADPRLQAAAALDEVLSGRADENTFLGAEQVLRSIGLTYRHWEQVEFALLALIYGDQLERAELCCEQLLGRVGRAAEGWRPPLLALRAQIAVRQGRLLDAERYAKTALEELPWRGWG